MMPVTSRVFESRRQHPEKNAKYPTAIRYGIMGTVVATDIALLGIATYIFNNGQDNFVRDWCILKGNSNMGTHVAIDLISAAANRIRNFRPSAPTLTV